jgi:hypothetical protein
VTGSSDLVALRFSFPYRGDRLITIPFYLKSLRAFLREHRGKACWIVGGRVERPAYLLFKREVVEEVRRLIADELGRGLTFVLEAVDPEPLVRKYLNREREVVGYLDLPEGRLGSPASLLEEDAPVDYVSGFWAFGREEFIRAEECEVRPVKRRDGKEVPMLFLKNVVTTLYRGGKPVKEIRSAERFIWLTGIDEDCLRGKWKEIAKRLKER